MNTISMRFTIQVHATYCLRRVQTNLIPLPPYDPNVTPMKEIYTHKSDNK